MSGNSIYRVQSTNWITLTSVICFFICLNAQAQPYSISVVSQSCDQVVLRSSGLQSVSSLIPWVSLYWQTSSTGTSTSSNGFSDYTVTGSGTKTIYLRSQTFGQWRTESSKTITIPNALNPGLVSYTGGKVCQGTSITIRGSTPTGGTGSYRYQWQRLQLPFPAWENISGATSKNLSVTATSFAQYRRRVISGNCGAKYSNPVGITGMYPLSYQLNAGTISGTKTIYRYNAAGTLGNTTSASWGAEPSTTISYQWQVSTNGSSWSTLHGATGTSYKPGTLSGTRWYRRKASTSTCGYVKYTESVKITVTNPPLLSDQNYVKAHLPQVTATSSSTVTGMDKEEKSTTITYFDGLGRAIQSVEQAHTPFGNDLVSSTGYDAYGRTQKNWLPFPIAQTSAGGYVHQTLQANRLAAQYEGEANHAHVEFRYEASPLDRLVKTYAPGASWSRTAGNRPVTTSHLVNATNEVRSFTHNHLLTERATYYPKGALYKRQTINENGHLEVEYVNKQGLTVQRKAQVSANTWATTCYIFDDLDRLRVIIPPEATNKLASDFFSSGSNRSSFLNRWAFQYEYNESGLMTRKKVPGSQEVYLVYDRWDRLVLTQDGNQRLNDQWIFTTYDALNRMVITGILSDSKNQTQIQRHVLELAGRYVTYNGSGSYGYNNSSYPFSLSSEGTIKEVLTVTYYDTYDFINKTNLSGASFQPVYTTTDAYHLLPKQHTSTRGQLTGKLIKGLENNYLASITYYDEALRPIQVISENHLNGKDVVSNQYDFSGNVRKTQIKHVARGQTKVVERRFDYDHENRLIDTWHKVNDESEVQIAHHEYNELGELIETDLHSGGAFTQSQDFTYNIRGWLTAINSSQLTSEGDTNGDLFGMELYYDTNPIQAFNTNYDGTISGIQWSNFRENPSGTAVGVQRAYSYQYDRLNRLTGADHQVNGSNTNRYDVNNISYDLNGNIKTLSRRGATNGYMDRLTYTYKGNHLLKVKDHGNDDEGFKDGNPSGNDYAYDENGNIVRDLNKGITAIDYNHLNLPTSVAFQNGDHLTYRYDATGRKLSQTVHKNGNPVKTTDYIGAFIYEDEHQGEGPHLQLIQHEEGRVVPIENGMDYQYHLKDHLGNIRLTFSTTPENYIMLEDFEDTQSDFTELKRQNRQTANSTKTGTYVSAVGIKQTSSMVLVGMNKGDTVNLSVKANYESDPDGNSFLPIAFSALHHSFDGAYGGAEGITSTASEFDKALLGLHAAGKGNTNEAPRAFINFIFFDEDMQYRATGFKQISKAALGVGVHELVVLDAPFVADQKGYLLAYLSNENKEAATVFFDDFTVYHGKTNVVSAQDYYPFGLTYNNYKKTASTAQKYKYGGKEEQEDWGVGIMDFEARFYDGALGRFMNMDPLADDGGQESWTPYHYTYNNPMAFVDPSGLIPSSHIDTEGKIIAVVDDGDNGVYQHEANADGGTPNEKMIKKRQKRSGSTSGNGTKVGETEHSDEFVSPETGKPMTNYKLQIGKSFDPIIADMNAKSKGMNLMEIAQASKKGKLFDIKAIYKNVGALLNGKYATSRSAGNFLAGYNAVGSKLMGVGISFTTFQKLAGALHIENSHGKKLSEGQMFNIVTSGTYQSSDISKFVAPLWGEVRYQYRMSRAGWNFGETNGKKTPE